MVCVIVAPETYGESWFLMIASAVTEANGLPLIRLIDSLPAFNLQHKYQAMVPTNELVLVFAS